MNLVPNRQAICDVLMEKAGNDHDLVVLCSDSRGSASLTPFAEKYPEQFIEVGIAEQDLVGISAGLAKCGKRAFAAAPACFLTTRSYEQCKVDVCYSNTNVKLIGISGGISYGALGMSHHSSQDIAVMSALPNMRVYLPSDRHQTRKLFECLLTDDRPAYIRVGRNPTEDIYDADDTAFLMDRAVAIYGGEETSVVLIACGEMVYPAMQASRELNATGITTTLLDMYCIKPLDKSAVLRAAKGARLVVTIEEHAPFGGLGSMVAQVVSGACPTHVVNLSLPDAPVIAGTPQEVFSYYGLDSKGILETVVQKLEGLERNSIS